MNDGILGQWWRIGGICGVAFIIVFLVAGFGIQGESPTYNDPIEEIRAYWENDGQAYLVGDYLLGLATLLLLLPFIVCLRTLLARSEGEPPIWSTVGFYGGLFVIVVAATAAASWTALAFAAENLSDDSLMLLMYLDLGAWNAFPYVIGVWLLFSSFVIVRTGALWKWLGYSGLDHWKCHVDYSPWNLGRDSKDVFDTIGFLPFIELGSGSWRQAIECASRTRVGPVRFAADVEHQVGLREDLAPGLAGFLTLL